MARGAARAFDSDRSRGNRIVAAGGELLRATPGMDVGGAARGLLHRAAA